MPAVVESPPVARIDRQLAHAAGRIRATDVLTGILAIVVMTLCYAAVMILVDRTYTLPGWVRQLGLLGWLGLAGVTAYRLILRPFGQRVNPLYVAKQVESAIPDAKNVVVNYVDLKDKNLPATVRDAVAGRASAEVTDSDVQKAGESRRLVTLGIASAVLAVVLAVMFLVFSPAQFLSLAKRTFRPFATVEIVSKTRLSITFPSDPNLTVTVGQPVVLQVALDGRLPSTDGDDRVRLLLRHNNEDPNYEAIPFEAGGTNREFQLKVPEHLVQNGFWYKVAGGDGETPEYRVTVRLRPLVLGVSVTYDYPEYLRMSQDTVNRPGIEAYRGTKITVIAKTNRPLQSGKLTFDGKPEINPGTVSPDDTESIRFQFIVGESGTYRLYFTATDGESNLDPPAYPVKVIVDNPPTVVIAKPEAEEIPLPANGQLAIDAVANDDIGLSKLTIQLRKVGPQPLPLQGKPYALQLKREDDKSFPTQVEMKDSVALAELKTEAGQTVSLAEGDVIEYWIEAVDNCGVPAPQVGKSAIKRVKILPPEVKPEQKQEMEKKTEARKNEEKKQQDQQKQKFDKEQRPPPPGQKEKGEEQPGEKQPGEQQPGEKQPGDQQPGEKQPGEKQPGEKQPDEKQPGEKQPGEKQPGEQQPGEKQPGEKQPGEQPGEKQPGEQQPMPGGTGEPTPEQKAKNEEIQNKANDIAKEIEKQKQQSEGGAGQQQQQQQQPMAEPKAGDESQGGAKPQAPPEGSSAKQKPNDNDSKPDPKNPEKGQPGGEAKPGQSDSKTGESKPGAEAGTSKPMGGESKPQPGNGGPKPTPEQMKEIGDAAKDLNSTDPAKQKAAQDKLDKMMGKENREKAEKLANDLKSNDQTTRENAEKQLKDMADKMAKGGGEQKPQQGNAGPKPTPEQMKEMADAAKDLNSSDPDKKKAAQDKLDKMMGKENREKAEKLANDLKSNDQTTRENAEKQLKDMADKMAKAGGEQKPQSQPGNSGQKPTPEQMKEMADAAKDLNSSDPDKKKAAQDKLDKMMGKENREKAEKLANDLKSNDQATRENAEKQLKDMADKMAKGGGEKQPQPGGGDPKQTPEQQKENEKAMKDLASDDAEAKKKAQDTLDKNIGEQKRKEAEKHVSDSKSNNPMVRNEAEQKLDELAGKGKEDQGGDGQPKPKGMSPEEAQKLADKAKDLASKDEQKRKDAEKELDDKIGKENREKLQQTMNDLNSGDPKKMEEAQKQIEDWKKQAQEQNPQDGKPNENWKPGGFGAGKPGGDPLKDNPADRLKAHELQLKTFKENQKNKNLLEKLGYSQEEYDRFVKGFEELVESERKRIEVTAKTNPPAAQPKAINVNRGGEKIGARGAEGTGPQGSSAGTAPPGYSDASRKFGEAAAKKKPKGGEK